MNSPVYLFVYLASVCLSYAVNVIAFDVFTYTEFKEKSATILKDCAKQNNANFQKLRSGVLKGGGPGAKDHQCLAGCFVTKMGLVTDVTLDSKVLQEANPHKYQTPDLAKKINQITEDCAKLVTQKVSDVCELSRPVLKCLHHEIVEPQLSHQEMERILQSQ